MNRQERHVLKEIRDDLMNTLAMTDNRSAVVTDIENLEDISFVIQRTLSTLEHQIEKRD